MKFPCLIRRRFCKTPIEITVYGEGVTEDGAPEIIFESKNYLPSDNLYPSDFFQRGCVLVNYQDRAKTVFTKEKKIVQANGTILIPFDLVPSAPVISGGFVVINGIRRDIVQSIKARNPDGTVNFTQLEVV